MGLNFISILFAALAIFSVLAGIKLLSNRGWFLGFIRGAFGVGVVLVSIFFAFIAYDIHSYGNLLQDKPIATISFKMLDYQNFEATYSDAQTFGQKTFNISGDQWQMDARILRWRGVLSKAKPNYRLERLGGRYYSIDDESDKQRTVHQLEMSEGLDFWSLANRHSGVFSFVDATYGSAVYLPMTEGAMYEVSVGATGLTAKPINSAAQEAVNGWN